MFTTVTSSSKLKSTTFQAVEILILFIQTLVLYKSFTYLLTYLLTIK